MLMQKRMFLKRKEQRSNEIKPCRVYIPWKNRKFNLALFSLLAVDSGSDIKDDIFSSKVI